MRAATLVAIFACLVALALAQTNDFPVVGEPRVYPGQSIAPQNQGGSLQTRGPFANQPVLTGLPYTFPGYTQNVVNGVPAIGGAFPGQVVGAGVDPVRGVFRAARNGFGHSSSSATGRSGHGAASGDGFFIAETKYPERTGLRADQFITRGALAEQLDTASASFLVAPMLFASFAALAMLL